MQPQEGAFRELLEHVAGEGAARHVADVEHQVLVVRGAVREGEGAAPSVPEQDVDVLAGPVLEALGGGELEAELHHVVGEAGLRRDPRGEGARPGAGAVGPGRDTEIRSGARLAEQGPPGPELALGEAARRFLVVVAREVDAAGDDPAAARPAGAVAAAVREGDVLAERRVEDGFVRPGEE